MSDHPTEINIRKATINIRRARPDDAQKIGAVFKAAAREEWQYLGDLVSRSMFSPETWVRLVAEHEPPKVLLVATNEDGEVVGYTAVHPQEGELHLLFVHPKHAHQGVDRALLSAAHETLRAAGCREVCLYTNGNNKRAPSVYATAGYRHDGAFRE